MFDLGGSSNPAPGTVGPSAGAPTGDTNNLPGDGNAQPPGDGAQPISDDSADDAPPHNMSDPIAPLPDKQERPPPEPIRPLAGGYYTSGNQVLDSNDNPVVFRGIARPSLEWDRNGQGLSAQDFTNMKSWGANVTRLALNQSFWLEGGAYQDRVAQTVDWAKQAGLAVILDLHWSDRGGKAEPAQQPMADQRSLTFWTQVATRFKDDPKVMFELYNEPKTLTCGQWLNGGSVSDAEGAFEAVGMQALYDAVRGTGAPNIVLIGGRNWAYDLVCLQVEPVYGTNIIYVSHIYDYEQKQPDDWDRAWTFATTNYPVMITEFGYDQQPPDCGRLNSFSGQVLDRADQLGVGWVAWAWFPSDCSFPALLAPQGSAEQGLQAAVPSEFGNLIKSRLSSY